MDILQRVAASVAGWLTRVVSAPSDPPIHQTQAKDERIELLLQSIETLVELQRHQTPHVASEPLNIHIQTEAEPPTDSFSTVALTDNDLVPSIEPVSTAVPSNLQKSVVPSIEHTRKRAASEPPLAAPPMKMARSTEHSHCVYPLQSDATDFIGMTMWINVHANGIEVSMADGLIDIKAILTLAGVNPKRKAEELSKLCTTAGIVRRTSGKRTFVSVNYAKQLAQELDVDLSGLFAIHDNSVLQNIRFRCIQCPIPKFLPSYQQVRVHLLANHSAHKADYQPCVCGAIAATKEVLQHHQTECTTYQTFILACEA